MGLGTSLCLEGAEFRYPEAEREVIGGIDLEIRAGEWVALLGPNGSGKSTLLKLYNALLLPTQGRCFVGGMETAEPGAAEEIRSKVSLVFQNPEDQIVASVVEEDTAFGPENLGLPPEEIRERVFEALNRVGLWEKRKSSTSSLSGGQKQRLALAGILAIKPACLLLDEATSMLDPASRKAFLELVKKENELGRTIVQVTHRLEEISSAERTVVVMDGKIHWQGGTEEFLSMNSKDLEKIGFSIPPAAVLKNRLADYGMIPRSTRSDIEEIKKELCFLK